MCCICNYKAYEHSPGLFKFFKQGEIFFVALNVFWLFSAVLFLVVGWPAFLKVPLCPLICVVRIMFINSLYDNQLIADSKGFYHF